MRVRAARLTVAMAIIVVSVLIAFLFILRARSREAYGPPVALCPGPDHYGYSCESAAAYAYIDATTPTGLFADDAVTRVALPFPFVFYGVEYDSLTAGSNGNLQFSTSNPLAFPACLAPAAGMGDLISPYWADLDLTLFGALETAVIGESPDRIFVVEWDDVPLYGPDTDDRVSFEVQLHEGEHDIIFLYEDPATVAGGNGGRAVVGIQSEKQGLSLSLSCLQSVLPTGGGLRFAHPSEPNPDPGRREARTSSPPADTPASKGPVAELMSRYAAEGTGALEKLRARWLNDRPQRAFIWKTADLTGDGRDELIALWRGRPENPGLAQIAVMAVSNRGLTPLLDMRLATRQEQFTATVLEDITDLTGDGREDVLLRDIPTGRTWVITAASDVLALLDVPERCSGGLITGDFDSDGRTEIVRDGCATPGRLSIVWNGQEFVPLP